MNSARVSNLRSQSQLWWALPILAVMLLLLHSTLGFAHQTGQATFVVHVKPETRQVDTLLACPVLDVAHAANIEPQALQAQWNALGFYLDPHIKVSNNGAECRSIEHRLSPQGSEQGFWFLEAFECDDPLGDVELFNDAMTETEGGYRHVAKVQVGEDVQTTLFTRETPTFTVKIAGQKPQPISTMDTVKRFVLSGIEHIAIGFDHILFVIALVLGARRLRELLIVVTAFTVSHSVTLALASLEIVMVPGSIVEPIIAASIIWAAFESVVKEPSPRRTYLVTFLLGLVHGFGFASVLSDVGLPPDALAPALVSFNVGVEIGQLAIVAVAYPLRRAIRDKPWERKALLGVAGIIGLLAAYWLVERLVG